jgi:hypothetical protein
LINCSKRPLLAWNSAGYGFLLPGETSPSGDSADFVFVGGVWYKIHDIGDVYVDDQGAPYYYVPAMVNPGLLQRVTCRSVRVTDPMYPISLDPSIPWGHDKGPVNDPSTGGVWFLPDR